MKYLKIELNDSITYPYEIGMLRIENPNTSFPQNISNDVLEDYNVYIVNNVETFNDYTKNYTEGTPQLINGQYFQNWIITDATEEEINQRIDNEWSQIRNIRNQYLSESDWTQLNDAPFTQGKKAEWIQYRQALRDITTQPDPFNITWPTKPQ